MRQRAPGPRPLAARGSRAPPNPREIGAGKLESPLAAAGNVAALGAFKEVFKSCLNFCRALSLNTHFYLNKKDSVLKIPFL